MLLVTVPAGIVACGVGISFVKWLDKNSDRIYGRLLGFSAPARPRKQNETRAAGAAEQEQPEQKAAQENPTQERPERKAALDKPRERPRSEPPEPA
jgi:hypothetical protein